MTGEADHAPFGKLRYGRERGVEYWRGSVTLASFDQPFALIVRAGQAGPSQRQAAAMTRLLANAVAIKREATGPMSALHRESGLSFPATEAGDDGVWASLQPEEIDVTDDSYYRDGRVAILLIFGSTLEPSFAPAIETADGRFQQALSGT